MWTQRRKTILVDGAVPTVHFVEESGLFATQEEAIAEATAKSLQLLKNRFMETYDNLKDGDIPKDQFVAVSQKDLFVENRILKVGSFEEPMYRAFIKFEDSPHVREPIIEALEQTAVSGRVRIYVIGMAGVALALAFVSSVLRIITAEPSRRSRAIVMATTLAVVAGAIAVLA